MYYNLKSKTQATDFQNDICQAKSVPNQRNITIGNFTKPLTRHWTLSRDAILLPTKTLPQKVNKYAKKHKYELKH